MSHDRIQTLKAAHEVLAEFAFKPARLERGYANRSLRIDLSTRGISELPVTQQMKDLWVGGKGFDLWYTLQEITAHDALGQPGESDLLRLGPARRHRCRSPARARRWSPRSRRRPTR